MKQFQKKTLIIFTALLSIAVLAFFAVIKLSENKNEIVFQKGNHLIKEDLNIPKDKTLIIKPGAHLIISKDVRISIAGKILAIGTEKDPIIFDGDGSYWRGIEIVGSASTPNIEEYRKYFQENDFENSKFLSSIQTGNVFAHCTIRNLQTNGVRDVANRKKAALEASNTSLFVTHTNFEDIVQIGAMQINDCFFLASHNKVMAKMIMKVFHIKNSVYVLNENDIIPGRHEFQTWPDGLFGANGVAIVTNNKWEGLSDDAIDFDSTLGFVMNNSVNGTFDDGISFDNQSEGFAIGNSITNVFENGLMISNGSEATLLDNAVSKSQTGILVRNGAKAWAKNTIISENKDGILLYNGVPFMLSKKQYDDIIKKLSKINMADAQNIAIYEGSSAQEIVDFFKNSYYDIHGYKILNDSIASAQNNDFTTFAYLKKALKFIDLESFNNTADNALKNFDKDTQQKLLTRKNFLYLSDSFLAKNNKNLSLKELFDFKTNSTKIDGKVATEFQGSETENNKAAEKFAEAEQKATYVKELLQKIDQTEEKILSHLSDI